MRVDRLAPAKINLFLHVGPLGADGYHPVCSLMTFADVGDVVSFDRSREMSFDVRGPFADGLGGDDNLIVRARDALMGAFEGDWPPFELILDKRLPVAAGLGGGSSDAAAALNLICEAFNLRDGDAPVRALRQIPVRVDHRGIERPPTAAALAPSETDDLLSEIARRLGSDITACLAAQPVLARGRGDACEWPPVLFPDVDVVLVNPLKPSPTGAVYRAFDEAQTAAQADDPVWPDRIETPRDLANFLRQCRNDLEAPAVSLQPAIGEVLAELKIRPETLLARMSGSGATCFAICADGRDARDLALAIGDLRRDWWVQRCRLSGFSP
jgi:4-diphosphocytidyl-2-C-methyl-D-erythritol kinase